MVLCYDDAIIVLPQDMAGALEGVQPQANFQGALFGSELQVLLRLLRLFLQGADAVFQFGKDVPQAQQILLRLAQAALGFLFPVAEAGNPRRFLKDLPPVLAARSDNAVDLALPDDRISVAAQAGIHEQLVDVPQADRHFVDEVFAVSGTVIPARDRHRVTVKIQPPVGIVDGEGDLCISLGLAGRRAVEDDILHAGTAQRPGRLLPQHPTHRVADIALAASVRPHHGCNPAVKFEGRLIRERFKPLYFQRF